ncbi:MAG: glycosyltransferase [Bacteroidales bacterium]|nr:glycosyltransferase [Bacteroidales bacterium]
MERQDFIITSLQSWEIGIGTTIRNFTLEISKQNRVLYINTPLDHSSWIRKGRHHAKDFRMDVINRKISPLRKINDNLWVLDFPFMVYSINKIPFPSVFDFFNKKNNRKIAKFINKYVEFLNFKDYTLFIDNDIYRSLYLKELLHPRLSIYYRRDYIIGVSYWKRHGSRLEPKIIAKSDIAMGNSTIFCEELKKYNSSVYLLETGVNLDLYDAQKKYQRPLDIEHIPHPIIGYVGSIFNLRLDEDLICIIAEKRPDYSFVLTGPEDDCFKKSRLHQMKNVFFTGPHQLNELPAYVYAFDVCINPQRINEITIGNYPLKIDEYLALGKPVVATNTPLMNEVFKDQVHLAKNAEEYLTFIDKGIEESKNPDLKIQRIEFAQTHSWENRVKILYKIIFAKD